MESVNSLIKRLDATLQKYNLSNYTKLEPPLSDDERMIFYNKLNIDNNVTEGMIRR